MRWRLSLVAAVLVFSLADDARPADIQAGDSVIVKDEAPLMSGRQVLAWVPKGTTLTVREVRGPWVLVETPAVGRRGGGWMQTEHLLAAPGDEAPPIPNEGETAKLPKPTAFEAKDINDLRQTIGRATEVPKNAPQGLSKSQVDPAVVLKSRCQN